MPDRVRVQFAHANSYLTELIAQFTTIEEQIEHGKTVTLNLNQGDRRLALLVSRENVIERPVPAAPSSTGRSPSLSDNKSLVAAVTNTYSFDLGEVNRNISAADVQGQVRRPITGSTPSAAAPLRSALPQPAVTYEEPDWILLEDCRYAASDGWSITAKRGFRSDLASIPRLFWVIIAFHDLSLIAPIMHDVIYRCGGLVVLPHGEVEPAGRRFERKDADDLFLELMTRSNISYWKRNVAYLAVRAFGQSSWREG